MVVWAGSRAFQQTPIKHHRIVIANVGILLLDRKHKLHCKWGHIVSHVAHQYSRVDFYSSLEVNLSLYYGGVIRIQDMLISVKTMKTAAVHGRVLLDEVEMVVEII